MVVTQFTAVGTASAILALSKAAWKLGSSLAKIDQNTNFADSIIKQLAGEVKSLSNECDLVYAEVEELVSKSEEDSPQRYDLDDSMWTCLATQVEETNRTMQELEQFIKTVQVAVSSNFDQYQLQRKLLRDDGQISSIRTKIRRQSDNLRTIQLLINTQVSLPMAIGIANPAPSVLVYIKPCRADRELSAELERLQDAAEKLQRTLDSTSPDPYSHAETTLIQWVREVVEKSTVKDETVPATAFIVGGKEQANSMVRVSDWVRALESIRDEEPSGSSLKAPSEPCILPGNEGHSVDRSATFGHRGARITKVTDVAGDDSEDDLEADLAKAALATGSKSFEAGEWSEAYALLQETLRVLQQLPKHQRTFCDRLSLQYKLAVCVYHLQGPGDAEEALTSLAQSSAVTETQRGYVYDAAHILSLLYVRINQPERARSECEKALQGRRRLLGKQSNASLESMALLAHIYGLLDKSARAKSYAAMIPEERRDAVLRALEMSLGTPVEKLGSPSLLTRPTSENSDLATRFSVSSLTLSMETRGSSPMNAIIPQSPTPSSRKPYQHITYQHITSPQGIPADHRSLSVHPVSSAKDRSKSTKMIRETEHKNHSTDPEAIISTELSAGHGLERTERFRGGTLSRKEILNRIGCQPRDRIEEAVCNGDLSVFDSVLGKKKGFWQSKLRKRTRAERLTALHFAALFDEIEMARRLIAAGFNVNEVPYGYSTSLTPLKFAIGARQVAMVEFLIANGAKPSEPDSWSTLASQLMNRSWLIKTMSDVDKECAPTRMISILRILLEQGWDINAPFETSGATVLQQAVTFWTGSYAWDLKLRATIASFLCQHSANPSQPNAEGKTPYDISVASGHQDLIVILKGGLGTKGLSTSNREAVELPI